MLLKNKIIYLCLLSSFIACTSLSAQAATNSAVITATATVVDNTCTPGWPSTGISLALGRASLSDFTGTGSTAATKSFDLDLTNCGADATTVSISATGSTDTDNTSLFANNTTTGGATGVGLGLFGGDSQTTQLLPDKGNSITYTIEDSKVSMPLLAKLIQSSATKPTSGKFSSVVTIDVDYN